MDRHAVVWTRYTGTPRKLADMVLTTTEMRITKTDEAMHDRLPGISVLHDRATVPTLVYSNDQYGGLPPQMEALLPPRVRANMQRIILSRLLAKTVNVTGMPILLQEWELLLFAGRDGIGHLDVFRCDDVARQYYSEFSHPVVRLDSATSLWSAVRALSSRLSGTDIDREEIIELVGPTPAVSGFVPKLLANIEISSEERLIPSIVKVEGESYPGMLELERLCYRVHEKVGLSVPRTWLKKISAKGENFSILASERFDRDKENRPLPLESAYSILRTGSPAKFPSTVSGTMELLWRAIELTSDNPVKDRTDFFKRFVLSFVTGNGDLHLENWAMLGGARGMRLSPVFDPAPMRAYRGLRRNHDLLSALEFNGIGGSGEGEFNLYAQSGKTPDDLMARLVSFGQSIGIRKPRAIEEIQNILEQAPAYRQEAREILFSLPEAERSGVSPHVEGFLTLLEEISGRLASI